MEKVVPNGWPGGVYGVKKHVASKRKVSAGVAAAFLGSLLVCLSLAVSAIAYRQHVVAARMEKTIDGKAERIQEVISKFIYKAHILAVLVMEHGGRIEHFDELAATIVDDPAIRNILIAPDGIVSNVYPREGNEEVIGFNLLGPGPGNEEARWAQAKGELVFGGPFRPVQGGAALVGRLPVYLDRGRGKSFWGLVSVTLNYPRALDQAELHSLDYQDLAFELWRTNPDDGTRQVIAHSAARYNPASAYMEKTIPLFNATWHFRLYPIRSWYRYPENLAMVFVSVGLSFLIALTVRKNEELKTAKAELERLVSTDHLTGLLNRQGLFKELEQLLRKKIRFRLWYVDLNYFKRINDTFGHKTGDAVLVGFTRTVRKYLDGSQVFARISGDEFVLICFDGNRTGRDSETIWAAVENELSRPVLPAGEHRIPLSFSKGDAIPPEDGVTAQDLLSVADHNMYAEKRARYAKEKRRRRTDKLVGVECGRREGLAPA